MITYLGDFKEDASVYIMFNTFSSDDPSASCTITNFANTDVHVHKDDGLTQRNNAAGITVSVDFDGITGSHLVKVDTSDDTVAGFWVVGHEYFVRIEGTTIDGATINSVIGQFSLESRFNEVDVVKWLGTAPQTPNVAGVPKIDLTHLLGNDIATPTIAGVLEVDLTHMGGVAQSAADLKSFADNCYSPATGLVLSNLSRIEGTAQSASDLKDFVDNCYIPGTNSISLVDTCTTNTDVTALAAICSESRLAELDAANLPSDIDNILDDTGTSGVLLAATATSAQLVDDLCDEALTAGTHNVAASLGRRIRELGAYHITSGTAQAGATHSITLAAAETAGDHILNRNLIVILAGTGVGQTRTIVDYASSSKIAVVDRDWITNPDNTSEYTVIPDDTPLVANHGVATAGTSTTITIATTASAINSTYANSIIQIMAGTGAGQSQLIDSYNGTTKVVTVCDTWTTTPDNTSVYVILPYGVSNVCNIGTDALALINAECDTALTDYDSPTNTEMIARTLPTADYILTTDTIAGVTTVTNLTNAPTTGDLTTTMKTSIETEISDALKIDTIPDSYATDGNQPTIAQAILAIQQMMQEKSITGTTLTVKKPDGSTTAMTFTLDSATNPTAVSRTT